MPAGTGDRESQRCERGCEGGQPDAAEVDLGAEVSVPVPDGEVRDEGHRGKDGAERQAPE